MASVSVAHWYPSSTWRLLSSLVCMIMMVMMTVLPGAMAQRQQQEETGGTCTICVGGETPTGSFGGGNDCEYFVDAAARLSTDNALCTQLRAQGYLYCNCTSYPENLCPMCVGNEKQVLPAAYSEYIIPQLNKETEPVTCAKAQFIANDGSNCDIVQQAAWYCGCANAERGNLYLCEDPSVEPNERLLPPDFQVSCQQLNRQGGLYYNTSMDSSILTANLTMLDVQGYCACQESEPANSCSVCEEIVYPDLTLEPGFTCSDLAFMATYVTDDTYCQSLVAEYEGRCCNVRNTSTTTTLLSPTLSPTESSGADAAPSPTSATPVETSSSVRMDHQTSMIGIFLVVIGTVLMTCT